MARRLLPVFAQHPIFRNFGVVPTTEIVDNDARLAPDAMFSIRLAIAGSLLANASCSFALGMTWGLHAPTKVTAPPAELSVESRPQLRMATQLQTREPVETLALQGAERLIGVRYHFGASSTSATDCSGLVMQAYAQAGVPLPRSTAAMMKAVEPIDLSEIRPGDLVFFRTGRRRLHVGLYQGKGMFVHASPKQREVTVSSLDQRWRKQLIGAGRVTVAFN